MKEQQFLLRHVFTQAVEIADAGQRADFVQRACGEDAALRRKVERLLQTHAESGGVLGEADTQAPPAIREKPGDRIGHYKLLEKIGEGGCGVVYMAEQEEPVRRRVAFKIIKLGMDTKEVIARLEAERQALALMDHQHIARFFDGGATNTGRPFFVMELVRGVRITDYCDQANLSTAQRLDLFMQVCQGVQHAHQKGIIHRDLKPSNILVTVNDGVPVPKIIDFGIAKATEQRLTEKTLFTKFHHIIGTPAYMSPEQLEMTSVDIDTRSDIYSLGVLLYQLLTGRTPFDSKKLMESGIEEMLRTIREQDPIRPSSRLGTLGADHLGAVARQHQTEAPKLIRLLRGDLDWIVMMCLEKDRKRRYTTANALAMDIQRHLNHEPVFAGPPTAAYRVGKLLRKYRAAAAAAAAFLLLLTSATLVSLWLAKQFHSERTKALQAEEAAKNALTQMQIQRAEEFFENADSARALAHLANVLTSHPNNRVAAERLLSALTSRNFSFPLSDPLRHQDVVRFAQFSPDGRRIVTASEDGTARIWDAFTGQLLVKPLLHPAKVLAVRFSPDGRWVATGSEDATARVWDAQTGAPISLPMRHDRQVDSVQFSPNGQWLVTASEDATARVWDARTGQPISPPLRHTDQVECAYFSPDGTRVVTASWDGSARIWNAQSGQPLARPLQHENSVPFAQFSPDGSKVVTASWDMTARVWDAHTGEPITEPLQHEHRVHAAQFSLDGLKVVTASSDMTARVWDAQTGKQVFPPLRHQEMVYSAQFSQDGLRLLTNSRDTTSRIWDALTGEPLTEPLRHEDAIQSAQFSPDGLRVVTGCQDKTARLWELKTGQPLTITFEHNDTVRSAQFSPDGLRVVTTSFDQTARVWDAQTGLPLTGPLQHEGNIHNAQFSPDGRRVVTASFDGTARIWDAQSGKPLTEPLRHKGEVQSAQFSPEGLRVVTSSYDGTAQVWDAQSGSRLAPPLEHKNRVHWAEFSPDGGRVVTASMDGTARIWNARTSQPLTGPLEHAEKVFCARFSPDGRRVATAAYDNTARVWDAQTGQPLTEPLRHEEWVRWVQFSPDGRRVATASRDKTARVWDAATGIPLTQPLRHQEGVLSVQFSPDGLRLVTASYDHTARVWDVQTGQPLSEPLRHGKDVRWAQFSPDGKWVLTASEDHTARLWETPVCSEPVPPWLPRLAGMMGAKMLNTSAIFVPAAPGQLLELKKQLTTLPATDVYTRWAKWFFEDATTRTLSPLSTVATSEWVRRQMEKNTQASLHQALILNPHNPQALAQMALHLAQDPPLNPRQTGEALFLAEFALTLSTNDPTVLALVRAVHAAASPAQSSPQTPVP